MWQFDKFTNTFIPGTLPADGSKITACYDRLSQEDEQEGDSIRLTSRGIGHGLGFCQNEADRRAAQGEDYMELLSDFFKGAKIRKI